MGRIKEAMKRLTHIITLIFLVLFISNGLPEEDVHLHLNLSISDFGEKSKTPDSQNRFLRTCSCGKAPKTGANRVIGGTEARPHEFPWMVRIVGGCAMGEIINTKHHLLLLSIRFMWRGPDQS